MPQKQPWYQDKFYVGQQVIDVWNKKVEQVAYKIAKLNLGGGYAVVETICDRQKRFRIELYKLRPTSENEAEQITEIPYRFRRWRRRVRLNQ